MCESEPAQGSITYKGKDHKFNNNKATSHLWNLSVPILTSHFALTILLPKEGELARYVAQTISGERFHMFQFIVLMSLRLDLPGIHMEKIEDKWGWVHNPWA